MKTKQKNLRLDVDVVEFIESGADKEDRCHGQWLSRLIRLKHMQKPKKAVKSKEEPLSFESWPYTPDQELITAWLKSKKAAKGSTSQTAINTIGKELHKAQQKGFSIEDCLRTAEDRKWRGFEASWMESYEARKTDNRSDIDRQFTDPLHAVKNF